METVEKKGLYIVLVSIHGLIRSDNLELGRDADTGGQTKYVVELAEALGRHPDVDMVDLFTRRIEDEKVDKIYAQHEESISDKAKVVRVKCGPGRYITKEKLWNYLEVFADNMLKYFRKHKRLPDVIHSHYADAGYVGSVLASLLGVPHVFTGHSLGREKKRRLMDGGMSEEQVEKRYNISRRIEAEEIALDTALFVTASTKQEIDIQYSQYENYREKQLTVNPPGVDISRFAASKGRIPVSSPIFKEISRFLTNPRKPIILAISRADERKNIRSLVEAFGSSERLQQEANLVIIAGNRDEIETLDSGAAVVINRMLRLIDKYDLYGKIAYPKHHKSDDIPDYYRLCGLLKGVFVNPALTEPFGLTLIEAAASGVPIVATNDGGPKDIIKNCKNGELVDPLDIEAIENALYKLVSNKRLWSTYSRNGVKNVKTHYTWDGHVERYISTLRKKMKKRSVMNFYEESKVYIPTYEKLIVMDIDNTLLGDEEALEELKEILLANRKRIGFGVATGRRLESAKEALEEAGVPAPDFYITSVGSEINYGKVLKPDLGWSNHISFMWMPDKVREVLDGMAGVTLQPAASQRDFKVSYFYDPKKFIKQPALKRILRQANIKSKVIMSHGQFLDILPERASKGLAVRYLGMKWGIEPENILVAGDSGNDEDMLKGNTLGVVVGNYSKELEKLKGRDDVYFAGRGYAGGIIEGIEHFNFLNKEQE